MRAEVERLRSEVAAVESERVREREAAALEKRDALEKLVITSSSQTLNFSLSLTHTHTHTHTHTQVQGGLSEAP